MTSRETTSPTGPSTTDHSPDTDSEEDESNSSRGPEKVTSSRYRSLIDSLGTNRTGYLGSGLFVLSLTLGLASLGGYLYSATLSSGATYYWPVREATFALAPLGFAVLLFSVTVLLPGSRRLVGLGVTGTLICALSVAMFTTVYPENWSSSSQGVTGQVVGGYALGLGLLILTTGIATRTRRRQLHQDQNEVQSTSTTQSARPNVSTALDEGSAGSGTADGDERDERPIHATHPVRLDTDAVDDLGDLHTTLVAAPGIHLESDAAQIGNEWVRTLYVAGYPDRAQIGMLESALAIPTADFDYSIHVNPRDPSRTIASLKKNIRDLKVKQIEKSERGDVTQLDTERTLAEHETIYSRLIEGSQQVFDVGIYVTIRAEDREQLDRITDQLRTSLQAEQLTPKSASFQQDDALVCTSPIARDVLGHSAMMLGDGVGALFPFSLGTHIERDGVLMGYHSVTGSPLVVDRFAREKGYNCFVVGNTGAGKTFDTVLNLLRTLGKDDETMVIIADPFGDLAVLSEILDGERIVVSGTKGLNPLELSPTPEHILERTTDLDPYKQTVQKNVMGFLEAFFEMENTSLEGKRGVASVAVREAYQRKGITPDPATHGNESPTLRDVRDVLRDITQNPLDFIEGDPGTVSDIEVELWTRRASQLRMDLEPFREGGEYEHLARQTEVEIGESSVVYLDMQQVEGEQKTGLMLQLLLHAVYEQAKQTDKRVIFAIDEAHYLMQSSATLAFLERAVRHSRHFDLSIQLITQTVDEFFSADKEQAKTIADNCSLKVFHQVEGLSDANAAEWLGFSPPEAEFVRTAKPGSEADGYSQALVEVGEVGRFPINVRALPEETALITGEADQTSEKAAEGDSAGTHMPHSQAPEVVRNGNGLDDDVDEEIEPITSLEETQIIRRETNGAATDAIDEEEAVVDFDDLEPEEAARLLKMFGPKKLCKDPLQDGSNDPNHQSGRDGTQ
jgi:Cdc6-like AAA superfamily ATPase